MQSDFYSTGDFYINYIQRDKPFNMPVQHYHNSYEIYYLIDGTRRMFMEDSLFELKSGGVWLIKPFILHHSTSMSTTHHKRYVVNFSPDILPVTQNQRSDLLSVFEHSPIMLEPNQQTEFLKLFKKLHRESDKNTPLSKTMTGFFITELLYYLYQLPASSKLKQPDTPILSAIKYINENFARELTLEETADIAHMSQYYFCRQFKKITGASFLQYLNNLRIKEAYQLILSSDMSFSEIAAKTGFSSTAHLCRIFKQNYGLAPREFKKRT